MNPRRLTRIAFFAASKRLGGVRVHGRRSVSQQFNQAKSRHLRVGQLRQQANALGHSTFHEYDLFGRETYTWGPTYSTVQDYDAYGQRNLLRTFRDTSADFSSAIFPINALGESTTWIYDDATGVLLQKLYADNKGPSYTYYADGLLKTRTWARKDSNNNPLTTTYLYNAQGHLANINSLDGIIAGVDQEEIECPCGYSATDLLDADLIQAPLDTVKKLKILEENNCKRWKCERNFRGWLLGKPEVLQQ